ncbi:MAG: hypothetical protein RSC76_05255 [Oscillospiraceae bacterium]
MSNKEFIKTLTGKESREEILSKAKESGLIHVRQANDSEKLSDRALGDISGGTSFLDDNENPSNFGRCEHYIFACWTFKVDRQSCYTCEYNLFSDEVFNPKDPDGKDGPDYYTPSCSLNL